MIITVKTVAFSGCTGLRRITLSKNTVVERKYGSAGLPNDIEVHFTGMLADWCDEATRIDTLSNSYSLYVMHNNAEKPVTQIPLQGTELSDIVYIRDHAFQNCKSLKEFHHYFAKSITHFGKYAFADAAITYFDIEGVAFISGNYTWYKTEDKAAWKASDMSRAEKVDKTNLTFGSPEKDFAVYNKDANYYWFAVKNPE